MKKFSLHIMVLFAGIVVLFSACSKKSNVLNGGNNYTVSGHVLETGAGLSDVSVRLTGNEKNIIAITDSTGLYAFSNIPEGAYTITPYKNNYSMNPANRTVTVADSNVVVPVFVDVKTFYSVSGRVIESSSGLPGVSIHFTGAGKDTTAVTSSTGSFI
ncbi:MAG: carboxypeptidase-like regulatory domain-containing protein, partial [Candidatus Latescibacter sp.]|nr:carboxypeptidase-like regulatory domain-containing protein [Candidatus Latescibacter sp.]